MTLVLDTSVTMSWCFDDEQSPETDAILRQLASEPAVVPQHWPVEVANVLLVAERHNRLSPARASEFIHLLETLLIEVEVAPVRQIAERWLALGHAYQLSAYDAAYLDLAMRHELRLATKDQRLQQAALQAGVSLSLPA